MHSKADFAESATSQHFPSSVELWCGFGCITLLEETLSYQVTNPDHFSRPWWKRSISWTQSVATFSNLFGNSLWRHLTDGQSFFCDVDGVSVNSSLVFLLTKLFLFLSFFFRLARIGAQIWGSASSGQADVQVHFKVIWNFNIGTFNIIHPVLCLFILDFHALFRARFLTCSSWASLSCVELSLQVVIITSFFKSVEVFDMLLLISVVLAMLRWFLLLSLIRRSLLRKLSCFRFGLLASSTGASVNEHQIVGSTPWARAHGVLLICQVRTLVLISRLVWLLIFAESRNLCLCSCYFVVLINKNHLLSLMLTLQNWWMTSISLWTLEISLVLAHGSTTRWCSGCATGILLLLLLNHDVTLRFQMLSELATSTCCLIAQELVSFLLMRFVASIVVAGEIRS